MFMYAKQTCTPKKGQGVKNTNSQTNARLSKIFTNSYLLESTWSQMGHAPSLPRILLASSVPFHTIKETFMQIYQSTLNLQKKKKKVTAIKL